MVDGIRFRKYPYIKLKAGDVVKHSTSSKGESELSFAKNAKLLDQDDETR